MDSLEHLITRSIKTYYKNRLYAPIIFLVILMALAVIFPVKHMLLPRTYSADNVSLYQLYNNKETYGKFKLSNLYFTGYTSKWLDRTRGYYYYTMLGSECVIVLLDPDTCEQGAPTIEQLTVRGQILYESEAARSLLSNLARDLNWSEDGILSTVSSYTISEPDATGFVSKAFEFFYVLTGAYSALSIIIYCVFIAFPVVSIPVQKTRAYGKPAEILAEAEEELATLPQLATEDMFITEHYFIETSSYGVAIVPIDAIIWIYKYSTMHKFLWHHFSITYTLYITAAKRHYIKCPKNIKSDIDGIMDYLAEANHDILVGFSEENRLKVEEIQDDFEIIRKISGFLSKRV
ncbi:DUF6709 family protein [Pseudobutyrivibrio xylanivorans]|uniref:Uncharacterized protein n=1 Tax=Pseudobutyrivibrio xylanivorans DSM 14809 TaxID=1123012 RepID=A0A1M6ILJ5_PSEXY|nr:DUF6709 family protein [Pseudobutyrivibrio xylanivorans]SHJ35356.1 hypothetical protein SAMN02745725_02358 [Pseudobutyrivibrio xylanivorans DSM 14809]